VNPSKSLSDRDAALSTKKACLMLAAKSFSALILEINLSKQLSHVMDVYEFPLKIIDENKCFQYKIIHSITPTNLSL